MPCSAFLSYSSHDLRAAQLLVGALERLEVKVWLAKRDLTGGDFYAEKIPPAIRSADAVLLLASHHSIGRLKPALSGSREVLRELKLASDAKKLVIPVLLDAALLEGPADAFAYLLVDRQHIDLTAFPGSAAYDAACRSIADAIAGRPATMAAAEADPLRQAEELLKAGRWQAALVELPEPGPGHTDRDRLMLLRTIALLQVRPLRDLGKAEVDLRVASLRALLGGSQSTAACYLLGVLSHCYYVPKAMHDPTGGLPALKVAAGRSGRLPARVQNMARPMLPAGSDYELTWRRS